MPILGFGKKQETLDDIEQNRTEAESKLELQSTLRQIAEQNKWIAELNAQEKSWKDFSANGKRSGISWEAVKNWLRTH